MPTVNGQRVLASDPRYTNTLNASGGINKTSQAELAGVRPQGSTGTLDNLQVKPAQPLVAPRLNPTIPDVIPSTALAGNKTFEDVMDTRADLETQATAKQQLTDRIKGTGDRINKPTEFSFSNPGAIIDRLSLNRVPTQTETQRAQAFGTAQQNRRDYATDISTARTEANAQFGLPDLTARKAEVTQQYAERQNQLDADIKRIEANAGKYGVDRNAVESQKRQVQSAALEDLSNLAAIEAAVSGSITEARTIINDTINDKKAAFELENQAIQQEIDYLSTLAGEDNAREAQTLQIALNEKTRQDNAQLAKEKEIKDMAMEAIYEGADEGTYSAMLKSGSVEEAMRYASPWLGKMDRRQAEANIAQSYASIATSNTNRLLALAEAGDPDAIKTLKFDPRTIKEEVDPVTRRQLEGSLDSGTNLLRLASNYQKLIDDYGYTNRTFGNTEVLGEISSLRALMTAEYKKAETLGTLDAGVLALMSQIIGEEPTSGLFTPLTNATGRRSDKLSSQIGTFIENITLAQARDKARLGIEPSVDFSVISQEDDLEINNLMGVQTTTNQQGFNAATYFPNN